MTPSLPPRVRLPSGRQVRLAVSSATRAERSPALFGAALALFGGPVALTDEHDRPVDVGALVLRDFHALRAIATHAGLLDESSVRVRCGNCDASFEVVPSRALEIAPFVDDELDDPELDAPFPFDEPQPIPAVRVGRSRAESIVLVDRTVDEARPLFAALARPTLRIDSSVVRAMGIAALGKERRPAPMGRAIAGCSDEAFDAIVAWFDEAHYGARLRAVVHCPECGASERVDAPAEREFPADFARAEDGADESPFDDLDAFEARVRAIADEVYRERGVAAVDLVVEPGVAEVDDGGVPLLGCYVPGGADSATGIVHAPEVTLFYRTFRAMWRDEGAYDLDGEIRETIDHELEHHLNHLAGSDPLDDEERAAIDDEAVRVIGRRETARRARAGFVADVAEFLRRTWPLWVVLALATVVATLAER